MIIASPGASPSFVSSAGYKWLVVAVLWVTGFLNAVDRHSMYALFPVLETDLGMTKYQLGLLGSAFLWPYAVLGPLAGYVGDRFARRKVIVISLLLWSAVTFLNGFAQSPAYLIGLRALLAITEAFYLPCALAMIGDHHGEGTRSKAVALHLSAMALGQVAGGFGGGYMAEHFDWRTLFFVLGGAGMLWVPLLVIFLHAPAAAGGRGAEVKLNVSLPRAVRSLLRVVTLRSFSVAFICYSVVGAIVSTWLAYFLYHRFSLSLTAAGFSANFYLELPTSVGNLVGGVAGDYFASRNYRGRMLTQAVSLALSAPLFLAIAGAGNLPQATASLVLLGFIRGAWAPNVMPVLCQLVPVDLRATAYGVMNFLGNTAGGIAALLAAGGERSRLTTGGAFTACAAIYWLAAGVLVFAAFTQLRRDFRGKVAETRP